MKSATFTLNTFDTLIMGTSGIYFLVENAKFKSLKYHVDLLYNSNNEIFQTLFADSITIDDTVKTGYLRGFIFKDIPGGADNFYVQLYVDTIATTDADITMTGSYCDDTAPEGNGKTMKSLIKYRKDVVIQNNTIPKSFSLSQNYPNPFNPVTKINYDLLKNSLVTIKIYDITGREIKTLVNETKPAGQYSIDFNGSNLASGVYFYRMQAGDFVSVKRMVIIK